MVIDSEVRVNIFYANSRRHVPWYENFIDDYLSKFGMTGIAELNIHLKEFDAFLVLDSTAYLKFNNGEDAIAFVLKWS